MMRIEDRPHTRTIKLERDVITYDELSEVVFNLGRLEFDVLMANQARRNDINKEEPL